MVQVSKGIPEHGRMAKSVKIGKRAVPLVRGRSVGVFSAGRKGEREKGTYYFWTAICLQNKETRGITGRAMKNLEAGERFRRMFKEAKTAETSANRKAYKKLCKLLQIVLYVRPANVKEVTNWLTGHGDDAVHLKSLRFLGA